MTSPIKTTLPILIVFFLLSSLNLFGQSLIDRGKPLYEAKKYQEAEKIFKAVPEKTSDYAKAQYYLGRIAFDQKNYDDASDYFKIATEVNPNEGEYFNWLGDAYSGVGSESSIFTQMSVGPKALRAWEKAAQLDSHIINARVSLVDSYLMAPEFMGGSESKAKAVAKEVLPLLDESLKNSPDNYLHHYWYGKIAALTGVNLDRGEELLLRYLKHIPTIEEPSLAGANMRLGQIKEKQGNKFEAKKYYETALKLDSKLEGAQKGLKRVSNSD